MGVDIENLLLIILIGCCCFFHIYSNFYHKEYAMTSGNDPTKYIQRLVRVISEKEKLIDQLKR